MKSNYYFALPIVSQFYTSDLHEIQDNDHTQQKGHGVLQRDFTVNMLLW